MALSHGARLGTYEILAPLGSGGMGEVYRARDTRLGREVAIKVLPEDRLHDEQRRRRLLQEAQSASALDHPNIVTIHEIESEGDVDFIVMEYVRGTSLDTQIPRHGMRLNDVLRVAIPVADALAAAHARGIVHRDLKPANVMVADGGGVKVLDFGLAKLVTSEDSRDELTVTQLGAAGLSAPGTIAGTAAYMAPEQAAGGAVDARSDVFSFGSMLYEMSTGARAFAGASVADTLSAVIHAQPTPPTQLVAALPRELERLILRCLRKEPDRRYQAMLDVRNELQDIKEESDSGTLGAPPKQPRWSPARVAAGATLAVGALAVIAVAASFLWPHTPPELPPMRVTPLTSLTGTELVPSLSPNGEQVAFAWDGGKRDGNFDIYLKLVGSSDVRQLTTSPDNDFPGGWSPDGRQLACLRRGPQGATIYLVEPVAGTERKVVDFPVNGVSWTPDGRSLIAGSDRTPSRASGVYLIPIDGGSPRPIVQSSGSQILGRPSLAPDGRQLAYMVCTIRTGDTRCDVELVTLDEQLQPNSKPRRVTTSVEFFGGLAWGPDGTSLIYTTQPVPETFYLWRLWVTGNRPPERLDLAGLGSRMPAVAAAQHRLAFVRTINTVGIYTMGPSTRAVLTSSFWDVQPQFSPDGSRLAFTSSRSGETLEIWVAGADGSNPHQLTRGPGHNQGSPSWSPDGRTIAFDSKDTEGWLSVWTIDADGGAPHRITNGPGDQNTPSWSRDGRWIYFTADQGHGGDIWRAPVAGGPAERVTRGGSTILAIESMDGKALLYKQAMTESPLLAQPLAGGPAAPALPCVWNDNFTVGLAGIYYAACGSGPTRAVHLFTGPSHDRVIGSYDDLWRFDLDRMAVSPDGKTILIHRQALSNDLMLIENFR